MFAGSDWYFFARAAAFQIDLSGQDEDGVSFSITGGGRLVSWNPPAIWSSRRDWPGWYRGSSLASCRMSRSGCHGDDPALLAITTWPEPGRGESETLALAPALAREPGMCRPTGAFGTSVANTGRRKRSAH